VFLRVSEESVVPSRQVRTTVPLEGQKGWEGFLHIRVSGLSICEGCQASQCTYGLAYDGPRRVSQLWLSQSDDIVIVSKRIRSLLTAVGTSIPVTY
jgi:hypothetical protein